MITRHTGPCYPHVKCEATCCYSNHELHGVHACRCVDAWEVVDEDEIAHALLHLLAAQSKLVEGAAGCALAAVR